MLSFLGQGHLCFKNCLDPKLGTCCTLKPSQACVVHPRSNTRNNEEQPIDRDGHGCSYWLQLLRPSSSGIAVCDTV
eukprot:5631926-Amphidinium_carterae.1